MVVGLTLKPSLRNPPFSLSYPSPGLSRATWRIHCSSSASIDGRPGCRFCLNVHLHRTISRCQPRTVAGLNSRTLSSRAWREWLTFCFNRRTRDTSGTFCQRGICGPRSCFRSMIRSCYRSNRISRSFSSFVIRPTAARSNTKSQTNKITRKNIGPSLPFQTKPRKLSLLVGFFQELGLWFGTVDFLSGLIFAPYGVKFHSMGRVFV